MKCLSRMQAITAALAVQLTYGVCGNETPIQKIFEPLAVVAEKQLEQDHQNLESKSNQELFEKLNPHWIHQISDIVDNDQYIKLEDGSLWTVGWWWRGTAKHWEEGDLVFVKRDLSSNTLMYEIFNGTKNQVVWVNIGEYSSPSSLHLTFIEAVDPHRASLVLSNGLEIRSKKFSEIITWSEKEPVMTVTVKSKTHTSYGLINIMKRRITWDLSIANPNSEG
ncbi:MAG: hypothetical protein WB791_01975 [Waddliaceae bacterium]